MFLLFLSFGYNVNCLYLKQNFMSIDTRNKKIWFMANVKYYEPGCTNKIRKSNKDG